MYQVLLAHLGEISVDNMGHHDDVNHDSKADDYHFMSLDTLVREKSDRIFISVTNMNLYSVDFDKHKKLGGSLSSSSFSGFTHDLGVPILYDTAVDLCIRKQNLNDVCLSDDFGYAMDMPDKLGFVPPRQPEREQQIQSPSSVLEVHIKISKPIKLGLSKEVYEQILQTSDHLTYDAEVKPFKSDDATVPDDQAQSTSEKTTESEMGSADHDDGIFGQEKTVTDKRANDGMSSLPVGSKAEGDLAAGNFMAKHVKFQVPLFGVELRGDFGDGEQGLVDLKLYDFALDYEKNDRVTTHLKVRLKSLQMDDLLEPMDSVHRQIIVSRNSHKEQTRSRGASSERGYRCFMSTSCPDCTIVVPVPQMPPSLPSSFHDSHSLKALQKIRDTVSKSGTASGRPLSR